MLGRRVLSAAAIIALALVVAAWGEGAVQQRFPEYALRAWREPLFWVVTAGFIAWELWRVPKPIKWTGRNGLWLKLIILMLTLTIGAVFGFVLSEVVA